MWPWALLTRASAAKDGGPDRNASSQMAGPPSFAARGFQDGFCFGTVCSMLSVRQRKDSAHPVGAAFLGDTVEAARRSCSVHARLQDGPCCRRGHRAGASPCQANGGPRGNGDGAPPVAGRILGFSFSKVVCFTCQGAVSCSHWRRGCMNTSECNKGCATGLSKAEMYEPSDARGAILAVAFHSAPYLSFTHSVRQVQSTPARETCLPQCSSSTISHFWLSSGLRCPGCGQRAVAAAPREHPGPLARTRGGERVTFP